MKNTKDFEITLGDRPLKVKVNVAEQAGGSCLVQYGETSVLGASTMSSRKLDTDFFPLTVEYQEKFYAAGKILGSRFTRREGNPTVKEILSGRVVDRSIRPLFPTDLRQDTQVILYCLTWDEQNSPTPIAALSASLSLGVSDIPWNGPIACVQIGRINGELILNPTYEQKDKGDLNIIFSAAEINNEVVINMIEVMAEEVGEEAINQAVAFAKPYLKQLIDFQKEIIAACGKAKQEFESLYPNSELEKEIKNFLGTTLEEAIAEKDDDARELKINQVKEALLADLAVTHPDGSYKKYIATFFEEEINKLVHELATKKKQRIDGRGFEEIRPLSASIDLLPRVHASALFTRGMTHALSILTLGAPGDQQILEGIDFIGKKRYLHHYNFPPYSSGEVKQMRGQGRRELGHGMLAENALRPVIPEFTEFPYTIRVVTEILSSNGSTSMASTCGSTLALMAGGVPLKRPVAGISIGLMTDLSGGKDYELLTDIKGAEDHYGDMDFKVAGTEQGITAIQLDVKIGGLTEEMISRTLEKAKTARFQILEVIKGAITEPRKEVSQYAPVISHFTINPEKIGELIGPKGKTINEIIDRYGVNIDIEDSGDVYVSGKDRDSVAQAQKIAYAIVKEFKIGEIIEDAKIVRIAEYGAFAEISPTGVWGLIHISQLANKRVAKTEDIVKIGDVVRVKVIGVDDQGKVSLSLKDAQNSAQ